VAEAGHQSHCQQSQRFQGESFHVDCLSEKISEQRSIIVLCLDRSLVANQMLQRRFLLWRHTAKWDMIP
jgi:hypothetical protein